MTKWLVDRLEQNEDSPQIEGTVLPFDPIIRKAFHDRDSQMTLAGVSQLIGDFTNHYASALASAPN
jgi:hypothetical protein